MRGEKITEAPVLRRDHHWIWCRRWAIVFWRAEAIIWVLGILIGTVGITSELVREGLQIGIWFFCVAIVFGLRYLRTVTLGIAVLPDRLLVSRALSLHPQEIPLDEIGCCMLCNYLGMHNLAIYLKPRWRAPVVLFSDRLLGIPRERWVPLVTELREILEPMGKWKRFPWWRQPFWL